MPFIPECTICHGDNKGGIGNFRRVTGTGELGMGYVLSRQYSLDPDDQSTWGQALDHLKSDAQDTDGDGTPDATELVTGDPKGGGMPTDPNDPTPGASIEPDTPSYGCVRVSPRGRVDGVASAVSAAVLALGVARCRASAAQTETRLGRRAKRVPGGAVAKRAAGAGSSRRGRSGRAQRALRPSGPATR